MIEKIFLSFLALILIPTFSAFADTDSKISIDMEYIVISPGKNGSTQIMDMVNYKNFTDQEYKGEGQAGEVISVLLPEGATGLSMLDENIKIIETETGFITTDPIPAKGSTVLPFSYQFKEGQDIVVTFKYPIDLYQILVPEGSGSVEVKDAEFAEQGLLKFDKQNYWGYSIQNIQPNQTVTLTYNKEKQPEESAQASGSASTNEEKVGNVTKTAPDFHNPGHLRMWEQSALKDFNPHILMIVLGAILIAGIGYFSYFRLKSRKQDRLLESDQEEKAFKLHMSKQKAILEKILELEESYEKGQISESDYHTKLGAYKQHLVQVKLSLSQYVE